MVEVGTFAGDLARKVSAAVTNTIGLTPSQVVLVPKGTLPTTPNGKLRARPGARDAPPWRASPRAGDVTTKAAGR